MPKRDSFNDLQGITFNKLGLFKPYWGISKAAIIFRAKTLGVIDPSTYKYLMIELGRRKEESKYKGAKKSCIRGNCIIAFY